ncbi:Arc family DNA-binding protein [Methylobacterium sp. 391_Methyba4]|uniref:Arc family DNA-binding protein n=1 Tax=Methylobacterium sp. 391_Methyba4 TaxID=3038924 RepID=UPI00241F179D|nr:Arc family DNA-binding protein [Methylobacterium sp. 391_Methyba4]WFS07741.1 Arc family DNA-binding protein [Methylobacterium sp. 391_Methyba4]
MSERKRPEDRVSTIPPFGLRMLPTLRDKLTEAARASGRSLNAEIVARLESTLNDEGAGSVLHAGDAIERVVRSIETKTGAKVVITISTDDFEKFSDIERASRKP